MRSDRISCWLVRSAAALLSMSCLQASHGAPYVRNPFQERIDALVREGFERPEPALAGLDRVRREQFPSADEDRQLLQAAGSIEAQAGHASEAARLADALLAIHRQNGDVRAEAAARLVQAQAAENAGRIDLAGDLAQSAMSVFGAGCPSIVASADEQGGGTCEYRSAWRALLILERRSMSLGLPAAQATQAQAALALARWAGDLQRQSTALGSLAMLAQGAGDQDLAQRLLTDAARLATQSGDPVQLAVASGIAARIAGLQHDDKAALRLYEEARAQAARAGALRLEARMLNNLSSTYARLGRPADALQAAERALPVFRQHGDLRAERVLIGNIGVAKIGVGRIAEGKQDMAHLLVLWQQSGETGRQVQTLAEFGEALAAAGDERTALELYHRERTLSEQLAKSDRAVALKELQGSNAAKARLQDIALLGSDNALKTAELAGRDLQQRIWWVLSLVMLLATAIVALLYRRMRIANRALGRSHVQLRAQNERDPLTNLANRRHFQSVIEKLPGGDGFTGALLLVDIDHFKHVNDAHGHAAGDQVLIEVARRLDAAVRREDLVVRWGGEEFLVLLPSATLEQAEQTAMRLLQGLGRTPIACDSAALRVTGSVGYARFPLPPHEVSMLWEQAVNLVDMALYTAKNQGRNRAVGIVSTSATTANALSHIESDFERAWRDGKVVLAHRRGPGDGDELKAA